MILFYDLDFEIDFGFFLGFELVEFFLDGSVVFGVCLVEVFDYFFL